MSSFLFLLVLYVGVTGFWTLHPKCNIIQLAGRNVEILQSKVMIDVGRGFNGGFVVLDDEDHTYLHTQSSRNRSRCKSIKDSNNENILLYRDVTISFYNSYKIFSYLNCQSKLYLKSWFILFVDFHTRSYIQPGLIDLRTKKDDYTFKLCTVHSPKFSFVPLHPINLCGEQFHRHMTWLWVP